jgi:hypothetical protein
MPTATGTGSTPSARSLRCEPRRVTPAAAAIATTPTAAVNPDGQEVCNGYDDDCDELVDGEDSSVDGNLYYPDRDNDGFGSATDPPVVACSEPFGQRADATDCDDDDAAVNTAAIEVCNGRDDNCVDDENDAIDRDDLVRRRDGDTYGRDGEEARASADRRKVSRGRAADCHDERRTRTIRTRRSAETDYDYNC